MGFYSPLCHLCCLALVPSFSTQCHIPGVRTSDCTSLSGIGVQQPGLWGEMRCCTQIATDGAAACALLAPVPCCFKETPLCVSAPHQAFSSNVILIQKGSLLWQGFGLWCVCQGIEESLQ